MTDRQELALLMREAIARVEYRNRVSVAPAKDGRRRPLTEEHREKLRAAHQKRFLEVGGRRQTEETRARISASRRAQIVPRMAECHPEEKHWGKGLCRRCYNREYMRQRRSSGRVQEETE